MTLAETMENDLEVMMSLDEFAQTITYGAASIPAFVEYVKAEGGNSTKYAAVITVKASDVPAPAYRTAVTISGAAWVTGQPEECEGDGQTWKIPLARAERPIMKG